MLACLHAKQDGVNAKHYACQVSAGEHRHCEPAEPHTAAGWAVDSSSGVKLLPLQCILTNNFTYVK